MRVQLPQPRGPLRHVMMRREKFEALCNGGNAAFVVFPPWHEVGGAILARNCEQDPGSAPVGWAAALQYNPPPATPTAPGSHGAGPPTW